MIVLIKHEAFNQSYQGMQAVAAVVVNRKQSKHYPESICAVAKQHKQFSGILKSFQAKPHRKSLNALEAKKAAQVSTIAYKAVVGRSDAFWRYSEIPKDVLWYHTKQVKPRWTAKLKVWGTIQDHVFYTKE